jgi:hypothetical protein
MSSDVCFTCGQLSGSADGEGIFRGQPGTPVCEFLFLGSFGLVVIMGFWGGLANSWVDLSLSDAVHELR